MMSKSRSFKLEADIAKYIIASVVGVSPSKADAPTRKTEHVLARKYFTLLLTEQGHGVSRIGQALEINHATVIHYNKTFPFQLKRDRGYTITYAEIRDRYKRAMEATTGADEALMTIRREKLRALIGRAQTLLYSSPEEASVEIGVIGAALDTISILDERI